MILSIGVCAYNEAHNIGHCLSSISRQILREDILQEVIVVSSASTDGTDAIVAEHTQEDPRVRLVRQERREGKNSAVNLFMSLAHGDILVLVNADNTLEPGTLEMIIRPFHDSKVGVVGGRPIPVDDRRKLIGFAVYMLWDMHHRLATICPKVGELMAFRNLHLQIPTNMQSDEDLIRLAIEKGGLISVYAPEARVRNKGPGTLRDYLKQRIRVNIGERYMKRWYQVQVATWDRRYLVQAFLSFIKDNGDRPFPTFVAITMESFARIYASLHVAFDRGDRPVWDMVGSTKDLAH